VVHVHRPSYTGSINRIIFRPANHKHERDPIKKIANAKKVRERAFLTNAKLLSSNPNTAKKTQKRCKMGTNVLCSKEYKEKPEEFKQEVEIYININICIY
jgi:hypothetical protein